MKTLKNLGLMVCILAFMALPVSAEYTYTKVFPTMVTPSVTTGVAVVDGFKNITFLYKITGISTNVVMRPEGSLDGSVWVPMADDREDTTILAADLSSTYGYVDRSTNRAYKLARATWVSKSGTGTTPNVEVRVEAN